MKEYDYKENITYFATHLGDGVASDSEQCFLLSVLRTWQAEKSHGKPCAYRGKCNGKRALDER